MLLTFCPWLLRVDWVCAPSSSGLSSSEARSMERCGKLGKHLEKICQVDPVEKVGRIGVTSLGIKARGYLHNVSGHFTRHFCISGSRGETERGWCGVGNQKRQFPPGGVKS